MKPNEETQSASKEPLRGAELTRRKILDAAVKHFGAHGYRGASLRNIISEAGVNLGAANYHFGSKKKVYFAVIAENFEKTRQARLDGMAEAAQLPKGSDRLRALIAAYISPHINLVIGKGEHAYGRLITQLLNDDALIADEFYAREINTVRSVFLQYLRECYPAVEDDQLARGIGFVVSIMAQAPFDPSYRSLTQVSPTDQPVEVVVEAAIAFAFGGTVELLGPVKP